MLSRRARLIYQAIALSIACALSLCLTVTTLFVGSLLRLQLSIVIVLLFVTAMLSLIGALLTFFREIILEPPTTCGLVPGRRRIGGTGALSCG